MYFCAMQRLSIFIFIAIGFICSCSSCENEPSNDINAPAALKKAPVFNAQNAFTLIEKQLSFGPRVPGTNAQEQCAQFIIDEIGKYVDTVFVQRTTVTQPISNNKYKCINIIGSYNPDALYRVLILAHWDSRPWADKDDERQNEGIMAADDGASGVAVMLELANAIKNGGVALKDVGVDFLFVDVEDAGKTEWTELSYSLGTQYWAANLHIPNYKANYGICLDMVGAVAARFPLEAISQQYAGDVQRKVWDMANRIGYSNYFVYEQAGGITDDHAVVNEQANIPTIDIINLQPNGEFGSYHHTHDDDIDIIDKNTLKAVGQTVLQVLYQE
jgi:glutaminyl-peptide cyclotransferase